MILPCSLTDKQTPFTARKSAMVPLLAATVSFVFGLISAFVLIRVRTLAEFQAVRVCSRAESTV